MKVKKLISKNHATLFHRTLLYGGIFAYAADKKSKNGKLRYLYEVAPMSMLMEQAGGRASNGTSRCLDHTPKDIHERMGVYLGSSDDITDLDLEQIVFEMTHGEFMGVSEFSDVKELSTEELVNESYRMGGEPSFFGEEFDYE